jgi:hypothetical protein
VNLNREKQNGGSTGRKTMRHIFSGMALAALIAVAMPGTAQAHYRHHHHYWANWCCCCCYYGGWHRHHHHRWWRHPW